MKLSGQHVKLVNLMKNSSGTNLLGAWVFWRFWGRRNRTKIPRTSSSDPSHHVDCTIPTPTMGLEGDAGWFQYKVARILKSTISKKSNEWADKNLKITSHYNFKTGSIEDKVSKIVQVVQLKNMYLIPYTVHGVRYTRYSIRFLIFNMMYHSGINSTKKKLVLLNHQTASGLVLKTWCKDNINVVNK